MHSPSSPDDNKHQQRVPVYLTDREFIDANAEAIRLDKKAGEIIRYALRQYLYGTVGVHRPPCNDSSSAD